MPEEIGALFDDLPLMERPPISQLVRQVSQTRPEKLGIELAGFDGPATGGTPYEVMDAWADAVGRVVVGVDDGSDGGEDVVMLALFLILLAHEDPTVEGVFDLLRSGFEDMPLPWNDPESLTAALVDLEPLGLVTVPHGEPGRLRLTDLGRYFAADVLSVGDELVVPLVGPMDETDPAYLALLMDVLDDDEADRLFDRWRTERGDDDAHTLIAGASTLPGEVRPSILQLTERLGPSATAAVTSMMENPDGTRYGPVPSLLPGIFAIARMWLDDHGVAAPVPESTSERTWSVIDQLRPTSFLAAPVSMFDELVPELKRTEFFADVWRIEHLMTADVLELIGKDHPDESVRRAARQALHKYHTRQPQ